MNEPFETVQKFCPQCSEAVDTDARFCKYCAFDLANSNISQDISTEINQTRTKRNTLGILGAMCLLILGLIGVVIKFNSGRINQSAIENANSVSQTSASTLTLGEKAQQIEQKILRGEALSESDLEGLSTMELRILRNVHFARYGRRYEKPGLGDYFYSQTWYKPIESFNDRMLTSIDKSNVALILSLEQPSNSETNSIAVTATPVSTPELPTVNYNLDSGKLTNDKAQKTINEWISSNYKGRSSPYRKLLSGSAEVIGVQELPQQNSGKADVRFINLYFESFGELITCPGTAMFTHYNDGRWVLTSVAMETSAK